MTLSRSPACSSSRWSRRSPRRSAPARLADAGARVIKIERAEGDFARGYDNAGEGRERLLRLAEPRQGIDRARHQAGRATATLLRAHARQGRRVHPEPRARRRRTRSASARPSCGARHPRLITVDISGYGESGPYARAEGLRPAGAGRERPRLRHRPAGGAGPRRRLGLRHRLPACTPTPAVLEALIARSITGEGRGHRGLAVRRAWPTG